MERGRGEEGTGAGSSSDMGLAPTQWSEVLAARNGQPERAARALELLCRTYWPPLYGYIRRRGYDFHEAQDLTQGFFVHLLRPEGLKSVERERGKFRAFLLVCLKNFLANEHERTTALKRGGGVSVVSLAELENEENHLNGSAGAASPEAAFARDWARAVLKRAMQRLRAEFCAQRSEDVFQALEPYLTQDGEAAGYGSIGLALGMSPGALRTAVSRLRGRYGALIRAELAQTVSDPGEVDEELQFLFATLGGG